MKSVSLTKPWKITGLNLADDVRRELQQQLAVMCASAQRGLLPVIALVLSGLWDQMEHTVLLAWSAVAVADSLLTLVNSRSNFRRLANPAVNDSTFIRRNACNYFLLGLTWGSLPVLCALWGSEEASWFGMIITMAILATLVLVLSTSHRVFFATLVPAGLLSLAGIALSRMPTPEMLALGGLYLAALTIMHNSLFQMQLDRVRSSLHNAAHASALAQTIEHHDPLTGLFNRAGLDNWLEQHLAGDKAYTPVLITLGNVVGFTELNALYGTSVADSLLTEIAARLVHESRGMFGIARLGGAEFILVDLRPFAAPEELLRKLAGLENEPFRIDSQTVSIGIRQVWVKGSARELDTLIEHAQTKLQSLRTDDNSSNQLVSLSLENRRKLVNSFNDALSNHQIQPWFQPIVDCHTNAITGWEALARWEHPEHGQITPDSFLVIARVGRQLTLLTQIMFKTSARFVRDLHAMGLHAAANVHVNITASELGSVGTLEWMEQILAEVGIAPEQIVIELSEKDALIIDEQIGRNLQRMQQIGMHLAIDDFGTGYSNLGQLLDLPAHAVKIDKRFVDKLPGDKASAALVRAVITLASGLGMKAIAEGVEQDVQLKFLRDNGCDAYQGFRAAEALPYSAALTLAGAWPPLANT